MQRRLPTAILLTVVLLAAVTQAAGEPYRPPIGTATFTGGASARETTFDGSARKTTISGFSPWLVRLRADWFALRWLGLEGEGSGDFYKAKKDGIAYPSQRGAARLGVALRFVTDGGFTLSGSLGYGVSRSPFMRSLDVVGFPNGFSVPDAFFSHGLAARIGVAWTGARFEGALSAVVLVPLGGSPVLGLEPQLWVGVRVAEAGPLAFWAGLDAGLLIEGSSVGYSSGTLRLALGLKVALLPPAPPSRPLNGNTTLRVQVQLPRGGPAVGAVVGLDGTAPSAVDAQGELVLTAQPGPHTANATLSGFRNITSTTQVPEGLETVLVMRLEALTGPGRLSGVVQAAATSQPIADATVTAGDREPLKTGADGRYTFAAVGPGPVKVRVDAQGFNSTEEVAQVPPEGAATLDVMLEALGKGSPATVRGLIRSRTGEPLTASVTIKGLATKVQVTPEGRFLVTVPGGQYLFVITAPGYVPQTKKVVLADGDQAIFHTELQKVSK